MTSSSSASPDDHLVRALDALLTGTPFTDRQLDAEGIHRLWTEVINGDPLLADGLTDAINEAVLALDASEGGPSAEGFDLALGNWTIDLHRAGVRAAVMSALLAGILAQTGLVPASIALLTAVVPSVLEIERIELRAGDRRLAIDLRLNDTVRNGGLTEDELYDALPDDARETVNRYDFANVVERLRQAGVASTDNEDRIMLQDPDARRPFLRLH